jgi:hypothetical protein
MVLYVAKEVMMNIGPLLLFLVPKAIMKHCTVYRKHFLCPFAVYYLRYAVTSFFTLSRISLVDGKRAGQKVQRKIAAAVQNVKRLYFLSRSFEISETNCQQSFFLP